MGLTPVTLTPADVALVLAALRRSVPPPAERAAVAALADRLEAALSTGTKTCVGCGAEFDAFDRRSDAVFCTQRCAKTEMQRRYRRRTTTPATDGPAAEEAP